jgi:hypothetical protein
MYSSQQVAIIYLELLTTKDIKPIEAHNNDYTSWPHLAWMLTKIINDTSMSETKTHRWLGFIQGCLIKDELLTVSEQREMTRSIFNGE